LKLSKRIAAILMAVAGLTSVGPSFAKPKVFGSWSTECQGAGKEKKCFASQVVAGSASGKDVLLGITVGKLKPGADYAMSFRFTNQAKRDAGIGFKLEPNGNSARAPIQSCDTKVCETKIDLDQTILKAMDGKTMMAFAFFDKQGQQITYPVRLEGLTNAIADLNKLAKKK
jgi:invasion protein IalB